MTKYYSIKDKLPRKLKKKIFGTRSSKRKLSRRSLASFLVNTRKGNELIQRVVDSMTNRKHPFPLTILTNNIKQNEDKRY